tara:strand:- start:10137 stop:12890 length:2754 start_codon:yes stop_codon:yes gene_type:complete
LNYKIDSESRIQIKNNLNTSYYVEAGAGTGKTTVLVDRIVSLILKNKTPINKIAAITFNKSAAKNIKDKIRTSLESILIKEDISNEVQKNITQALNGLETSSIQTLHSFADKIIRQFPIESGVAPGFKILSESENNNLFEKKWNNWISSNQENIKFEKSFNWLMCLNVNPNKIKSIAKIFWNNFENVETSKFENNIKIPQINFEKFKKLCNNLKNLSVTLCNNPADPLLVHINDFTEEFEEVIFSLNDWNFDNSITLYNLSKFSKNITGNDCYKSISTNKGNKKNWDKDPYSQQNSKILVTSILSEIQNDIDDFLLNSGKFALTDLLAELKKFSLIEAHKRKQRGEITHDDSLIWARNLVKNHYSVRKHFILNYENILIDEFQDTDPIQAEIAAFISESISKEKADKLETDWTKIKPQNGKLFAVGDPKQSIYKFRKADSSISQIIQQNLTDNTIYLTENFRSTKSIIKFVNQIFENLFEESETQPKYVNLTYPKKNGSKKLNFGSVQFFGESIEDNKTTDQIKKEEAKQISTIINDIISKKSKIRDEQINSEIPKKTVTYNDICILVEKNADIPIIENELNYLAIPNINQNSAINYQAQEIKDIINCLKAINNPYDKISIIAALKSPAFSCSDEDLFRHVKDNKSFNYIENHHKGSSKIDGYLKILNEFHTKKNYTPTTEIIEEFFTSRHLNSAAILHEHSENILNHYEFIMATAISLSKDNYLTIIELINYLEKDLNQNNKIPNNDSSNTVKIMTFHGAKGLEFPVVIMTGLGFISEVPSTENNVFFDKKTQQLEVRISKNIQTSNFENLLQKEMQNTLEEKIRLLYVSATRAKDFLIISLFKKGPRTKLLYHLFTNAAQKQNVDWNKIELTSSAPGNLNGIPSQTKKVDQGSILQEFEMLEKKQKQLLEKLISE